MNKGLLIFAFSLGAAVGSVITWRIAKDKYEQLHKEELEEKRKKARGDEPSFKQTNDTEEATIDHDPELDKLLDRYSSPAVKNNKKGDVEDVKPPYVISPDKFGEIFEYDLVNLTYYEDEVLIDDETDDPIDDLDNTVGEDFASHFGEYEDDSVHIRNEELMIDYEILREPRKYSDILRERSHLSVRE